MIIIFLLNFSGCGGGGGGTTKNIVIVGAPVLSSFIGSVDENATTATFIGSISVLSIGDSNITSMQLNGTGSSNFTISADGNITVASGASLDYEITTSYSLSARAQNTQGWSAYVGVTVNINNIADNTEVPLLLIAINFDDYTIQNSNANWNNKIFGTVDKQLNHYLYKVSHNNFQLIEANETDGTINDGIINVSLGINHPGDGVMDKNHLVSAITLADPFIDFSIYDIDFNNAISRSELQIMFIVAGGETAYGDPAASSIWAHAWSLTLFPSAPILDGVKLMDNVSGGNYSRFGEMHDTHQATIGIIAHELGHSIFNLPDLYDTDDSSEGIGNFGLMGSGAWGYEATQHQGTTPVHMCAWSKLEQGWITPTEINVTTNNIVMNTSHLLNFNILKLPTDNPSEYFLIENRSPAGYDAGLYILDNITFAGGLAIWHIDETKRAIDNSDNSDETNKLVDLEEANNPELDTKTSRGTRTNLYYSGNSTLFDDTSTPNSKKYNNASTNISVNNISIIGNLAENYQITIDISR